MNDQQKHIILAIKFNSWGLKYPCPVCGQEADPAGGPALFVGGADNFVCDTCERKTATLA
jgi:hypothetical protein